MKNKNIKFIFLIFGIIMTFFGIINEFNLYFYFSGLILLIVFLVLWFKEKNNSQENCVKKDMFEGSNGAFLGTRSKAGEDKKDELMPADADNQHTPDTKLKNSFNHKSNLIKLRAERNGFLIVR